MTFGRLRPNHSLEPTAGRCDVQQPLRRRMFMFAFAMFIILFALVTTMCSHH